MIAFLGLGGMGLPMAKRLIAAGNDVTVWNRSAQPADALRDHGARVAPSAREAVSAADIVITMLSDATAVESVLVDIQDAVRPDAVLVDMSTVGPRATAAFAARFPAYVDAPVMGSVDRAASGELVVFAGGAVERVADVLAAFGTVVPCGPVGRASALKVAMIGGVVAGIGVLSEVYAVARAMDLPDDVVERALGAGPLAALLGRARSADAHFPVRLAAKDLRLAVDESPLPIFEAVLGLLDKAPDLEADLGSLVPPVGS
jgi:3-hydroxyisobutyrate dehydrogenase